MTRIVSALFLRAYHRTLKPGVDLYLTPGPRFPEIDIESRGESRRAAEKGKTQRLLPEKSAAN
jgi:hypothetical protein